MDAQRIAEEVIRIFRADEEVIWSYIAAEEVMQRTESS
jgi:hypothetical protein